MISPFNVLITALVILACVLVYFSVTVTSIMLTINIAAVLAVAGIEVMKVVSDDADYSWSDNRKFALLNLATVVVAVNLSVLFLVRGAA